MRPAEIACAENHGGCSRRLSVVRLFLPFITQQFAVTNDGHQEEDSEEGPHHRKDYEEFGHMPPSRRYCHIHPANGSVTVLTPACESQGSTGSGPLSLGGGWIFSRNCSKLRTGYPNS